MTKTLRTPAEINAKLVSLGKLGRFSHIRPGTGKRGRPGVARLNELPSTDVLFVDEVTGTAIQGPASMSRDEAAEIVREIRLSNLVGFGGWLPDDFDPDAADDISTRRKILGV